MQAWTWPWTESVPPRLRLSQLLAVPAMLSVLAVAGCSSPPHRQNFGDLAAADRLELITDQTHVLTDRSRIVDAAAFFERYRDGWTSAMHGGAAPMFMRFSKDGRDIGTFGVGKGFLSVGSARRYPPEAEIDALVRRLGVPWPR